MDYIVNELGSVIIDLRNTEENNINLYQAYTEKTLMDAGDALGHDRSSDVKKRVLRCISNRADMTQEEKEEYDDFCGEENGGSDESGESEEKADDK